MESTTCDPVRFAGLVFLIVRGVKAPVERGPLDLAPIRFCSWVIAGTKISWSKSPLATTLCAHGASCDGA